jgi:hypothetical protein
MSASTCVADGPTRVKAQKQNEKNCGLLSTHATHPQGRIECDRESAFDDAFEERRKK